MAKVTVANLKIKPIHCKDKTEKLLDILLAATDWMHACGGKGRCTTCKAKVLSGNEFLSPPTAAEAKYMEKGQLIEDERLTCQVTVEGDITLSVPSVYQLPHLNYIK